MKTYFTSILILLCTGLFIVGSCKKDTISAKEDMPNDLPGHISGMGETDGKLTGKPFIFPEKIEIKGGIKGDIYLAPAQDYCQIKGSGAFVLAKMDLVNHFQKDTVFVLPAGLTFLADQAADQHGILIQETAIYLAKGENCRILLYLYCLNARKNGSSNNSTYTFGPITDAAPMTELIQLLKGKTINYEHLTQEEFIDLKHDIQQIVWKVTDYNGLTQEDKDYIKTLQHHS